MIVKMPEKSAGLFGLCVILTTQHFVNPSFQLHYVGLMSHFNYTPKCQAVDPTKQCFVQDFFKLRSLYHMIIELESNIK
jgi:hypothetical protein